MKRNVSDVIIVATKGVLTALAAVGLIATTLVTLALLSAPVYFAWNMIATTIFGVAKISFLQSFAIAGGIILFAALLNDRNEHQSLACE